MAPRRSPRSSAAAGDWPPSDDLRVWAWVFAAYLPSLAAWGMGLPFWVHGLGSGPYHATHPLSWMSVLPLLGLALALRRAGPFQVTLWLQLAVGAGLMLTVLEAPRALFAVGEPGSGLEAADYFEVMLAYGLAFAAGGVSLGGVAWLLRRQLSASLARGSEPRAR